MAFGITSQGFVTKQQADIQSDLTAAFQAAFGKGINTAPRSRFGQFIGILSERLADLWAAAKQVYDSQYPDSATGASLDNVWSITGMLRLQPTRSTTILACCGTPATALATGRVASVVPSNVQFRTTADATIAAATAWAQGQVVTLGVRRTANGNVYECTTPGTTLSSGTGPSSTVLGADIVDNTAHWKFLGVGTGIVDVPAESVLYGPMAGPANSIVTISTPVAGWSSVSNEADATLGTNTEVDPDGRLRRDGLLRGAGKAAPDAVRSAILLVPGVTDCVIFDNPTQVVDGNGVPGNSFESLVTGGTDAAVGQAIWNSKPLGIQAYGATTQSVVDSKGNAQSVKFTRPTPINIYVAVNFTTDSTWDAVNGAANVRQAIVNFTLGKLLDSGGQAIGSALKAGDDVFNTPLYRAVFSIPGVQDITSLNIGTAPAPGGSADIVIAARELAVFDTGRITVNGA
jgi:uncharacterized phage protein gp47/JayE